MSRSFLALSIISAIALYAACSDACAQITAPQPGSYTITDLGNLLGENSSAVTSCGYAINESGDVVVSASNGPFLVKVDKVVSLQPAVNQGLSLSFKINGYDEMTGSKRFPAPGDPGSFVTHAILYNYRTGKIKDLGTLPRDTTSSGVDLDDAEEVTGSSGTQQTPNAHVFLYTGETMTNLAGNDASNFKVTSMNSSGEAVGEAKPSDDYYSPAALFSNGSTTLLSWQYAYNPGFASGINELGQITGSAYREEILNAFLYSNGSGTFIKPTGDTYSFGNGINAAAQVVGNSLALFTVNPNHTFLSTPGGDIVHLESLIPADSGWTLTDAEAINDKGQITGCGTNPNGLQHAYLLSPMMARFSTLNSAVDILGDSRTTFAAGGRLTLGEKSDGIDPLTETMVLQLGGYHISIPPASFIKNPNGVYFYQGKIGNTSLEAVIRPLTRRAFLFGVVGQGVAGLPKTYPLKLVLTFGNDTGEEKIETNYDASGLNEAEVCKIFGLTCN